MFVITLIFLTALSGCQPADIRLEEGFYIRKDEWIQPASDDQRLLSEFVLSNTRLEGTEVECRGLCSLRSNCDIYVWFPATSTCQHRQSINSDSDDPGAFSGLKVSDSNIGGFVRYASKAMGNAFQNQSLSCLRSMVGVAQCEALCDVLSSCDYYLTDRACGCAVGSSLQEGFLDQAPRGNIGFKKNKLKLPL